MKYSQRRRQRKEITDTQPENSPTGGKAKRPYIIAAAILAVFLTHAAWQFSFVQGEKLRITEDVMNNAQLEVLPAATQPDEKAVEAETVLTAEKVTVVETVQETAQKTAQKTVQKAVQKTGAEPARSVVAVRYAPPENNRRTVETKKKIVREPRSERLRRAEKLLTGL